VKSRKRWPERRTDEQAKRKGSDEALRHFYRAIELDPNYAAAHGMTARAYVRRTAGGWVKNRAFEVA
jgi:hypothetical protein